MDDETIRKADRVIVHTRKHAPENYVMGHGDEKIEMHDPIDLIQKGRPFDGPPPPPLWLSAPELKELVAGRVPGRESEQEVTCFMNNIGVGVQFAALGSAVLAAARAKGVGREIPTEWFLQTIQG